MTEENPKVKARRNPIDPDGLQLMDECNRIWVQSWKEAIDHFTAMKVLVISDRTPRK